MFKTIINQIKESLRSAKKKEPAEPVIIIENVDRTDLLKKRSFWPSFYFNYVGTPDLDSTEWWPIFFNMSVQTVDHELLNEDLNKADYLRYFIELTLSDGFSVIMQNDDNRVPGAHYFISHKQWNGKIDMGDISGGNVLFPAFRWTEIQNIARIYSEGDKWKWAAATLLLFPGVGLDKKDDLTEVHSALCSAWDTLGIVIHSKISELADQNLAHTIQDISWENDPKFGWVCDGRHSFRNKLCTTIAEEKFIRIKRFTDAIEK